MKMKKNWTMMKIQMMMRRGQKEAVVRCASRTMTCEEPAHKGSCS